jgi:subfamily B ATP-binding cassette protein MsbA
MQDFRRLLKYLRPHYLTFALATLAMVIGGLLESATRALLVPIFDQAFGGGAGKTTTLFGLQNLIPADDWYQAWLAISVMLVAFTVFGGISEFFSSYFMAKIGQTAVLDLRKELYNHLLRQPSAFFERHRTNFMVSRLVTSCAAIEYAVSANLRDVLRESFNLVFFLSAAFYFNWRLMLGAMIIAPIIAFLTSKFSRALRKQAEQSLEGSRLLTDTAQEALANHTIVRAYRAEAREETRFAKAARMIAKANLRSGRIAALSPPVITTIGIGAGVVLLFFGFREIHVNNMPAAQFFTFLAFLFSSYDPMRKISRQHNELTKAFAAARDVWDILDQNESLPEKPDAVEIKTLEQGIALQRVSFNYGSINGGESKIILDEVDLYIPKGQMIALVGESGGGKSTITKLIPRFYDPVKGAVLWDGVDLRDAKLAGLREHIALVTQETTLFNDTVRYNISYGKPEATEEQIQHAAEVAFAADFIAELPQGYDTIVGERGVFLSGGQRQRIAIARAVLLDAPVLVLDEATSALDTESERLVQKALENLMQNRTSVVIAHRLSTVRRADNIVVMERGRIAETGTHSELLQKGGIYKRLYELQFWEDEEIVGTNIA